MHRGQRGHTLIELIAVVSILGLITIAAGSIIDSARRRVSLMAATSELRSIFQQARVTAVARNCNVGLKFHDQGDRWLWAIYEDRDGDGVRNDDIASGQDPIIQKARQFEHRPAAIALPRSPVPDPLAPGKMLQDRLPVRFGASTICSFTRTGEASNGSVVLSDGADAVIVRVTGATARINVLKWNGAGWRTGV